MALEPLLAASPWALIAAVGIPAAMKVAIAVVALRGSDPKDRPTILKALAEVFRAGSWWPRGPTP